MSKVLGGEKNAVIEAMFGISIRAKTHAVRRVEKRIKENRNLNPEVMRLEKTISSHH